MRPKDDFRPWFSTFEDVDGSSNAPSNTSPERTRDRKSANLVHRRVRRSAQSLGSSMSSGSFDVVEISSGLHEETLWVSVEFSSELERLDGLHFVCATEVDAQDRKLGHNEMYLERFDQAYSCYAGADEIVVTTIGVRLKLNARGRKSLALPQKVDFVIVPTIKGWAEAQRMFKRMEGLECGRVLRTA